jgi:hypothetical protein
MARQIVLGNRIRLHVFRPSDADELAAARERFRELAARGYIGVIRREGTRDKPGIQSGSRRGDFAPEGMRCIDVRGLQFPTLESLRRRICLCRDPLVSDRSAEHELLRSWLTDE